MIKSTYIKARQGLYGGEAILVYVYDYMKNKWLVEDARPQDPLPGTIRGSITVKEFLGPSKSNVCWSDTRALKALQRLQDMAFPLDIRVRYGFRRISEAAHKGESLHYAGLAFDLGQNLTTKDQTRLTQIALERCGFSKVEPYYSTPGWLHVEKQIATPGSALGEYPVLKENEASVYAMLLQDALLMHHCYMGALTGVMNEATAKGLRKFQQENGLKITGLSDSKTWHTLMRPSKNRAAAQRIL